MDLALKTGVYLDNTTWGLAPCRRRRCSVKKSDAVMCCACVYAHENGTWREKHARRRL